MIGRFFNWLFSLRIIVSIDYLERWHIIPENNWRNVFLHRMNGPDPGRDMHDHPWDFTTFILWGGYVEIEGFWSEHGFERRTNVRPTFSISRIPAEHIHAIRAVRPNTWTFVITGRRRREWGFHTKDGWVPYEEYFA